jgi:hypothetical protein
MDAQPQPAGSESFGQLLDPEYWLIFGLEWTGGGGMVEAAYAVAPGIIPRHMLGEDARQILECADLYVGKRGGRAIFFSDLTRMFASAGKSWPDLGVDWEAALAELQSGPFPALYLTISQRAHVYICDAATRLTMYGPGGREEATESERDLVRQALARQLGADWPGYVKSLIGAGKMRPVD